MKKTANAGFSIVEIIIAIALLGIVFIGVATAFDWLFKDYARSRELNEIYAALSGCPEIDRAMQYESIISTNCSPNDTFDAETAGGNNDITYVTSSAPVLTSALATTDPAYNIPDSKVVDVTVTQKNARQWKIRLLISRNGIGQQ
jgi:prepilin-type N-terminal cleavage/methylation domain-containing protein